MRLLRSYKEKLEHKFRPRIKRQGFNFQCDVGLANRVRLAAKLLEVPIYPLMEETIEQGLSDIGETVEDDALKVRLQRHLLTEHLLVDHLDPEHETVSGEALRLRNTKKLLDLYESVGLTSWDILKALELVRAEVEERA